MCHYGIGGGGGGGGGQGEVLPMNSLMDNGTNNEHEVQSA